MDETDFEFLKAIKGVFYYFTILFFTGFLSALIVYWCWSTLFELAPILQNYLKKNPTFWEVFKISMIIRMVLFYSVVHEKKTEE